jgi:hypothetical protein
MRTNPIMAVEQLHKSTPLRPVGALESLNELIKSVPNEFGAPNSCQSVIRQVRALAGEVGIDQVFAIDISKAYMQLLLYEHQQLYLGFIPTRRVTWGVLNLPPSEVLV